MITDGILSAVQGMIDKFESSEARNAGIAIWKMLAEFDEDNWNDLKDSGATDEWLKHYIE